MEDRVANLSWITGDQVYLCRVTPSPATINDARQYEFFAGHDAAGKPGLDDATSPGSSRWSTGTTTWAASRSPTTRR